MRHNLKKRNVFAVLLALAMGLSPLSIQAADTSSSTTSSTAASSSKTGSSTQSSTASDDDLGIGNQAPITFSFAKAAENKRFTLNVDKKEGVLQLLDKDTGKVWQSSPDGYNTDQVASGLERNSMGSQLVTTYADKAGNLTAIPSKLECAGSGAIEFKNITNGIEVTYHFKKTGFVIPVDYTINDDSFTASILTDQIQETNTSYRLYSVDLLPYFGAGSTTDNGYMFVPDGEGALINYNNGKNSAADYSQEIYGRDETVTDKNQGPVTQEAMLPVFGVKNGTDAFAGIITDGAARARLNAHVSGTDSSYNTVYTEFIYRDYDTVVAKAQNWDKKTFKVYESVPANCKTFTVKYCLLEKDSANYSGMAVRYQKYLTDEQGVKPNTEYTTTPLYLDLFGSVKKTQYLLGIPYKATIPLTTYDDVVNITQQLKDKGVNDIVINYTSWSSNSTDLNIPTSLSTCGALGGSGDFKKMTSYLSSNNIKIFCDVNLTDMTVNRWGFNKKWDSTRGLSNTPAMQYGFLLSTYEQDTTIPTIFLLKPNKVLAAAQETAKNLKKLPVTGLSANTIAQKLYSDFSKDKVDRTESEAKMQQALNALSSAGNGLLSSDANAYAFSNSTYITDTPIESSEFFIEDETVPFYQIALHGILPMSIPSMNNYSDEKDCMLKAIETGVGIKFLWTARNDEKLTETPYDYMYNVNYQMWIDDAVSMQQQVADALKGLNNQAITSHETLQKGVTCTKYANGTEILVNYNDTAVTIDGNTVNAKDYLVI